MLLGITADFHLGYQRFYDDSFTQARTALERAASRAHAIIIAGDVFDARVPRLEVIGRAIEILNVGKQIYAIHGTHERRAEGALNPIQLLDKAGLINDIDCKQIVLEDFDGSKIAITGFGGVPDEYAQAQINEKNFKPLKDAFNIFVLHQTISGFLPAPGIAFEALPRGFDLYVCGHIHTHHTRRIGSAQLIIPGSTVLTQLKKEEVGPKGFVLYDTKAKREEFITIPTRAFIHKEIAFSAADGSAVRTTCRAVLEQIAKGYAGAKPIVKIVLNGNLKEGLQKENVDLFDIRKEFEGEMFLEIENALETEASFAERILQLRRKRDERKSISELGIEMLKDKFGKDAEALFEQLSDEKNIDEFVRKNLESRS